MIKFKSENQFIKYIVEIILQRLKNKDIQLIGEVVRNHIFVGAIDLLLINRKNKSFLCIEFKVNDPGKLQSQVWTGSELTKIKTIGLTLANSYRKYDSLYHFKSEYSFGLFLDFIKNDNNWTDMYQSDMAKVYWYGYKKFPKVYIEDAGTCALKNNNQLFFLDLFKLALKEFYIENKVDDFSTWKFFKKYSFFKFRKIYKDVIHDNNCLMEKDK